MQSKNLGYLLSGSLLFAIFVACDSRAGADNSKPSVTAPQSVYNQGLKLLASGKQAEAERLVEGGLMHDDKRRIDPAVADRVFFVAVCRRSRFEIEEAFPLFGYVAAAMPDSVHGRAARLITELDGKKADADAKFLALDRLSADNPDDPMLLWMVAVQCRSLNKAEIGVERYAKLCKMWQPGPILVHQTCANLLDDLKRYDESLEHRKAAIKLEPAAWAYDGLGNTLTAMHRWKEADEAYGQATALQPNFHNWNNWAISMQSRGDEAGFRKLMEKASAAQQLENLVAEAGNRRATGSKTGPSDSQRRLAQADLLIRQNNKSAAVAEANIVLQESEDPALISRAQELAGIAKPVIPPLGELPGGKPILVLVPIGDIDLSLLADEQKRLHDQLGVEVLLRSVLVKVLDWDRDPVEQAADTLRAGYASARSARPDEFANALRAIGMTEDDLKDNLKAIHLSAEMQRKTGHEEQAAAFESVIARADKQWSSEKMLHALTVAVRPFAKPNIGFIGVTKNDIFSDGMAFVFANHEHCDGIISYRRFLASSYGEPDQRARLARRLHLQALGVAGYVFGIEGCSHPTCPRHPAAGLFDHDAKTDDLCNDCRKALGMVSAMPEIVLTPKVVQYMRAWISEAHADPKTAYLRIRRENQTTLVFALQEGNRAGYLTESGGIRILINHDVAAEIGPATIDDDETPAGRWLLIIPKGKSRAEGIKVLLLGTPKP